jgi:hypothetical protein
MVISCLLNKRKSLFSLLFFVTFISFAWDIIDVRDEVHLIACPYSSSLDNNVTTGIQSSFSCEPEPMLTFFPYAKKASVAISFLSSSPFHFRAPPALS